MWKSLLEWKKNILLCNENSFEFLGDINECGVRLCFLIFALVLISREKCGKLAVQQTWKPEVMTSACEHEEWFIFVPRFVKTSTQLLTFMNTDSNTKFAPCLHSWLPTRKNFSDRLFIARGHRSLKKYFWKGFKEVHQHFCLALFPDGVEASFCSSISPLKLFLIYSEADYFLECCQLWKLCQLFCHLSALENNLELFYGTGANSFLSIVNWLRLQKSMWLPENDF